MRILMMTNTYFPIVGGLEQSVYSFSEQFKALGHEVLIVTPTFNGAPVEEPVLFVFRLGKNSAGLFFLLIFRSPDF